MRGAHPLACPIARPPRRQVEVPPRLGRSTSCRSAGRRPGRTGRDRLVDGLVARAPAEVFHVACARVHSAAGGGQPRACGCSCGAAPDDVLDHLDEFLDARRAAGLPLGAARALHVTLASSPRCRRARDDLEGGSSARPGAYGVRAALAGGGAFPNVARARVLWTGLDLDDRPRRDRPAGDGRAGGGLEGRGGGRRRAVHAARHGRPAPAPAEATSWVRLSNLPRGPPGRWRHVDLVASFLGEGAGNRPRYERLVAPSQLGSPA